jgi:hypothetical protein
MEDAGQTENVLTEEYAEGFEELKAVRFLVGSYVADMKSRNAKEKTA